jgi:hypothetical protein
MRGEVTRVLGALRSSQGFLDDHAVLLDEVNKSGARKTLDDVATQLTAHAVNQDAGHRQSQGETANQQALRAALRLGNMKPIAEVAKMKLRDVPNFKALTLPRSNMRGARLVATAGAMADAASGYVQVFVDAGLPADFLAQLRNAAEGLSKSLAERAQNQRLRAGATEGLRAQAKRGRSVLRLLDGLVVPKLGTDDRLLAEWRGARKVHKQPGRVGSAAQAPVAEGPTPPTPVAAPSAAPDVGGKKGVAK